MLWESQVCRHPLKLPAESRQQKQVLATLWTRAVSAIPRQGHFCSCPTAGLSGAQEIPVSQNAHLRVREQQKAAGCANLATQSYTCAIPLGSSPGVKNDVLLD